MLTPGTIIAGKYEVESTLGSGGMASVYLVRHLMLEARFALKVSYAHSPGLMQRFVQEGQLQARLQHPGVVKVQDIIDVNGATGLIMEYVGGGNLDQWCQQRPLHALDEVQRLFRALVEAVGAAHAENIVHRDLKPANVLLSGDPGRPMPRVTDFGIAKVLDSASSPTRSNMGFGTVAYMAPEQAFDARSVDARADIFALGCVLYEMITGERAYPEFNPAMDEQTRRRDMDPRQVRAETPQALATAVVRCLRFRPEERPQSCKELLALLDGGSIPGPVSRTPHPITRPDSAKTLSFDPVDEPLPPVEGSGRWLLPGILVGITALIAVGVGLSFAQGDPRPSATAVPNPPEDDTSPGSDEGEQPEPPDEEPEDQKKEETPIVTPTVTPTVTPLPATDTGKKTKTETEKRVPPPPPPPPPKPDGTVKIRSEPVCPFTFRGLSYPADYYTLSAPPGDYTITFNCPDLPSATLKVEVKSEEEVSACWDFNLDERCL